ALRAGVIWDNTFNRFDPAASFGGDKESGFGREGGPAGLAAYLDTDDEALAGPISGTGARTRALSPGRNSPTADGTDSNGRKAAAGAHGRKRQANGRTILRSPRPTSSSSVGRSPARNPAVAVPCMTPPATSWPTPPSPRARTCATL